MRKAIQREEAKRERGARAMLILIFNHENVTLIATQVGEAAHAVTRTKKGIFIIILLPFFEHSLCTLFCTVPDT